ncbi:MAG: tRNA (guanosine(46)-N7)-methyltransferase TrmB [Pseudomonadota bacterium]
MKTSESDKHSLNKHIRSFGPNRGRGIAALTPVFEEGMPRFGLMAADCAQWDAIFPSVQPCVLEIGFGMGHSLYETAQKHPERNYIGVEVYPAGVACLLRQLIRAPLPNLKVFAGDAVPMVADLIPAQALCKVQVYFPDPWPKKRHQKRRIIQEAFIKLLSQAVAPGGWLHLATDWPDYAEHMVATLATSTEWGSVALPHPESERGATKFESRGKALGYPPQDFLYQRR